MNWTMPGVLDIYSVGDGELLYQIINTIAMFNNLGTLKTLAMIGLMIGLLLGPLKYVVSGGKDVDIAGPFAAILLVILFFGGRATVRIHDVSGANSGGAVPTYNVANVPAGLAITGWIVSGVGFKLAERYEQGFTYPSQQMTKSGFGRSAEMLASIRQARRCIGNAAVKDFCLSLVNYLRDCSTAAFVADPTRASKAMIAADPLDSTNGFGVDTGWISTQMVVGGTASTVTCSAALGSLRLRGQTQDGVLDGFAQGAVGLTVPQYADANAADRIGDAYNAISRSVTDAKQMMLAEMIRGTWAKAMVGNPNLTSDQELANVAIIEASEQQATQAALGDTVFRQFIQPLLAVIEGVLYVVAPFLAIALGLGRIGASFALKIVIFGLWSMTWMPMLSFINFFQLMMVERAVDAMTSANALSSYAGAQLVGEGVHRWVTVGSWMAAAVPALTYGLLSGSASGLMKIASGASGGADGKEKSASPDMASQSAAMQTSALATSTAGSGVTMTGSSGFNLEFGSAQSTSLAAARSEAAASSARFTSSQGAQVGNALMHDLTHSAGAGSKDDFKLGQNLSRAVAALNSEGYSFNTADRTQMQALLATALNFQAQGGVSTNSSGAARMVGGALGKGGGIARAITGALGLSASETFSSRDEATRAAGAFAEAGKKLSAMMTTNDGVRGDVAAAATQMMDSSAKESGSESSRVGKDSSYQRAAEDVQRSESSWRKQSEQSASAGVRQSLPISEFVQRARNADASGSGGLVDGLLKAASEFGGYPAMRDALGQVQSSGHFVGDKQAESIAAAAMVLSGQVASAKPGFETERAEALMGALQQSGALLVGGGGPSVGQGAPANEVDTGGVRQGEATTAVNQAGVGAAPGTEQAVSGSVERLSTAEGKLASANALAGSAGVDANTVTSAADTARANVVPGQGPWSGATFGGNAEALGNGGVLDVANANMAQVINAGSAVSNAASVINGESKVDSYTGRGNPLDGAGHGRGLRKATGTEAGFAPSAEDNQNLSSYAELAKGGHFTGGRPLTDKQAEMVGAIALVNSGQSLSAGQMTQLRTDWNNANASGDKETTSVVNAVNAKWHEGESGPRFVKPGAVPAVGPASQQSLDTGLGAGGRYGVEQRRPDE